MIENIQHKLKLYKWYLYNNKFFVIKLLLFFDVIFVFLYSLWLCILGFMTMYQVGGVIIFIFGAGFIFPLFPVLLANKYSMIPIDILKKKGIEEEDAYKEVCTPKVVFAMVLWRLLIAVLFYAYQLVVFLR